MLDIKRIDKWDSEYGKAKKANRLGNLLVPTKVKSAYLNNILQKSHMWYLGLPVRKYQMQKFFYMHGATIIGWEIIIQRSNVPEGSKPKHEPLGIKSKV